MKKKILSILLSAAVIAAMIPAAGSVAFAADGIVLATAFPDANLKSYVQDKYDTDTDGVITEAEVQTAVAGGMEKTELSLSRAAVGADIADFTGLEQLSFLTGININGGEEGFTAKAINVSTLPNLETLVVDNTQVSDIDVSNNENLMGLAIMNSPVESVDLSKNENLMMLNIDSTSIAELDISNNANLANISVKNSNITSLDISALDAEKVGRVEITGNAAPVELFVKCTDQLTYETKFYPDVTTVSVSNFKLDGEMKVKHMEEETVPGTPATCTTDGLTDGITCKACGVMVKKQEVIPAGHTPVAIPAVKATVSANGATAGSKCSVCNEILTAPQTIYAAKTVKLAAASKVYTGKALKPAVTIKDSKGNAIAAANYSIKYANNTKVGKATATVTFQNNYEGTKKLTFKINPKKAAVKSAVPGKKQLKVTAGTKVAATGGAKYKIAYKVKGTSTWKYKTTTNKTLTIKSLKKGKKYQVKIQAIKSVNGTTYAGAWSAVKTTNKIK